MARNTKKIQDLFEKVSQEYLIGKRSQKELQQAYKKLAAANKKEYGMNLDFIDMEKYVAEREKNLETLAKAARLDKLDPSMWRAVKKQAGIKKSGFLKKSDASVGKHLKDYHAAIDKWQGTRIKHAAGDLKLLAKAVSEAKKLQTAFQKFLKAKEFKTDMAKDLQKLCEDYVKQLDTTIKSLNAFQKQAGDTTAFKRTLQQCVMVNFKE